MRNELPLPCDDITERFVIGSVLLDGRMMDSVRTALVEDDFTSQQRKTVWSAACAAYDKGAEINCISVYQELRVMGKEQSGGWLEFMTSLLDGVPIVESLEKDIAILKSKKCIRRMIALSENTINRCCAGIDSAEDIQEALMRGAEELLTDSGDNKPVSTRDLVDRLGIDGILNPRRTTGGVSLPWEGLQSGIDGLHPGQLVIAAAYTSRGKTSLACQIATHCTKQQLGVMYWTTEMPPEALFRRMIHQMAGVDGYRHRQQQLVPDEMERAKDVVGWLYDNPVWFDFRSRTVPQFLASLRQVRQKYRMGLVVVDHIQHLKSVGRTPSRAQEVAEISRSLKMGALDFELPFLVLSQVSRPKEDNQPLTIHAIKESGDVENDADVVLLLNSAKPNGINPVQVRLNVAKQREGPSGFDVPLTFRPSTQAFESED